MADLLVLIKLTTLLILTVGAASMAVKAWERSHRPVPADTHRR